MLGSKLRELRRGKQITQRELAKTLEVSTASVGFWEIGKREPDHDMLVKISSFFHVTTDYLLSNNSENTIVIMGRNGIYKTFKLSEKNIKAIEQLVETLVDDN